MSTALATSNGALVPLDPQIMEHVLMGGDLSKLTAQQRVQYMLKTCESLGLNPLTKPFDFINLGGKLVMYARKDCTEQLRNIHTISIKIVAREVTEGCYVVTAQATKKKDGREDESIGAVPIENLKGEARSNAMMKAETKAKRRVTLSICGLGMLDESEIDSIPGARPVEIVGDNLEEKLSNSVAHLEAQKKAKEQAKHLAEQAEILQGEIVSEVPADEYRMPWDSTKGAFKKGQPISEVARDVLEGLAKWCAKNKKTDVAAAINAHLAERDDAP